MMEGTGVTVHGEGGDHCLWRRLRPFFAYSLLTQALCLGLIAFAVSFKVRLNHILTDRKMQEDTGYGYEDDGSSYTASGYDSAGGYGDYSNSSCYGDDDHVEGYEDEHHIRRMLVGATSAVSTHVIAISYCSSLTIVLASIELMAYSHTQRAQEDILLIPFERQQEWTWSFGLENFVWYAL